MPNFVLDAVAALAYLGKAVLMELSMDEGEPLHWCCVHIVGVVLPKDGVWDYPYFMVMSLFDDGGTPYEVAFSDIRTIRAIRHRDRHSSGNVLDRMTRPIPAGSGAALPARRNGSFVPSNGSTGAAHP